MYVYCMVLVCKCVELWVGGWLLAFWHFALLFVISHDTRVFIVDVVVLIAVDTSDEKCSCSICFC